MAVTPCGIAECDKEVKTADKALQCEVCDFWYHTKCVAVSDKDYPTMKKKGVHWICQFCERGSKKLMGLMSKMHTELTEVKEELKEAKFNIDRLEQYQRKDSTRLAGIPDPHTKDENTDEAVIKVAKDMGIEIKPEDISVSHRLGKVTAPYNRPLIVKFTRRDTKKKMMMNKKNLKEKAGYREIYINDDLTSNRYKIAKELRRLHDSAWTREGKIIVKEVNEGDSKYTTIDSYQDFCKLNWSEEKLTELGILQ